MKKGLLWVNLGTPSELSVEGVERYLKSFLMDKHVIDFPYFLRWPLVNLLIIPRRKQNSYEAYRKIWNEKGSPLAFYSRQFINKIQRVVGQDVVVRLGMRYGEPSIAQAIEDFKKSGVTEITVLPAYPHFAHSSTLTAVEEIKDQVLKIYGTNQQPKIIGHWSYEKNPVFIQGVAEQIKSRMNEFQPDFVLFSYHGLPVRHLKKISPECDGRGACSLQVTEKNKKCYRQQCYATTHHLVQELGLSSDRYATAFQSRLTSKWIEPFSDHYYRSLPGKNVKKLLVVCPSFTIDCLETLEEVAMRGRDLFISSGGQELRLVPCLNDSDLHLKLILDLAQNGSKELL